MEFGRDLGPFGAVLLLAPRGLGGRKIRLTGHIATFTIGIAIGFSDLFYITVNAISQSGQTLELIAMLMLTFLAINYSIGLFTNWLNARLQLKEH